MNFRDLRQLGQIVKLSMKYKDLDLRQSVHELNQQRASTKAGTANLPIGSSLGAPASLPASPGIANLPIGSSPLALSSLPSAPLPLSAQPLALTLAEVEKTQGPQSDAAVAEIAESILAEARKSLKRSA